MVVKDLVKRVTLYDLVEDASKSIDAYRQEKISGSILHRRLSVDGTRASVRLAGDTMTGLGISAVIIEGRSPGYILYGVAATAIAYAVDYFIFEVYSGKPL